MSNAGASRMLKVRFSNPTRIRQYEAAAGRVLLTRVVAGGELFAIHYGLVFGNTLLWHTPVINVAFLDYSPLEDVIGTVANSCDQRNIKTIDLGLGNESYKARFGNADQEVCEYI